MATTGLSWTGEFCLAMNDCGQYINEVGKGAVYDGSFNGTGTGEVYGDCNPFLDYLNYSDEFKEEMKMGARSYMDMSRSWFFWTWKTGANSTGLVPNPQWSYVAFCSHALSRPLLLIVACGLSVQISIGSSPRLDAHRLL